MKKVIKFFFAVFLLHGFTAHAQIVTKRDTINNNELSITMDKRVDDIIASLEKECHRRANTPKTNTSNTKKELSQAEICKKNPKILGYKVQIGVVKSMEEANNLRTSFREAFPSIKVEIDASLRPNYKVLAGSYLSKESAAPDLRRIKSKFKGSIAIQYRVFCVEAK